MRWILIVFAGLLATSALEAAPYEGEWRSPSGGRWVPEHFLCLLPTHESVMSLREDSLTLSENVYHCQFDRVRRNGAKFAINMTCSLEGEDARKDQMSLEMLGSDRMSVWRKSFGKRPARTLIRCPALQEGEKIRGLIDLWDRTSEACRTTGEEDACEQRMLMHQHLLGYDLCFGKEGEAEDRKRWHQCTSGSLRPSP